MNGIEVNYMLDGRLYAMRRLFTVPVKDDLVCLNTGVFRVVARTFPNHLDNYESVNLIIVRAVDREKETTPHDN